MRPVQLFPVSQAVSKRLVDFMLNGDNVDIFTELYTSYLRFTFGTKSLYTSPHVYRILVFSLAFFYKFILFDFQVLNCHGGNQSCVD